MLLPCDVCMYSVKMNHREKYSLHGPPGGVEGGGAGGGAGSDTEG